eukprot:Opistho-1_new@26111
MPKPAPQHRSYHAGARRRRGLHALGGGGKANAAVDGVMHAVVRAEEDVTEDPVDAGAGEVEALEGALADRLARLVRTLHRVLVGSDGEVVPVDLERERGELGDVRAVHLKRAVGELLGAEDLVDRVDVRRVAHNQRGARVRDGLAARRAPLVRAERERVEANLPVRLRREGDPLDVAGVVLGVRAADQQLAGRAVAVVAEVEREDLLGDEALVKGNRPHGLHVVDGNERKPRPRRASKPIESSDSTVASPKSDVRHRKAANRRRVRGKRARDRALAVLDAEGAAVLGIRRRLRAVVLGLRAVLASGAVALRARHPEVARARVKDGGLALGRRANKDVANVEGILDVLEGLGGRSGGGNGTELEAVLLEVRLGHTCDCNAVSKACRHKRGNHGRSENGAGHLEKQGVIVLWTLAGNPEILRTLRCLAPSLFPHVLCVDT